MPAMPSLHPLAVFGFEQRLGTSLASDCILTPPHSDQESPVPQSKADAFPEKREDGFLPDSTASGTAVDRDASS